MRVSLFIFNSLAGVHVVVVVLFHCRRDPISALSFMGMSRPMAGVGRYLDCSTNSRIVKWAARGFITSAKNLDFF